MSIRASSAESRRTTEFLSSPYSPPSAPAPEGAAYSRDLNIPTVDSADHVYDRDLNVEIVFDDGHTYNFGTPGSPHERWGAAAHRSAALSSGSGIRNALDTTSSNSVGEVSHEVDVATTHLPGYH